MNNIRGPVERSGRSVLDADGETLAFCADNDIAATIAKALNAKQVKPRAFVVEGMPDGLPEPPEPPEGCKWVYRGEGYKMSEGNFWGTSYIAGSFHEWCSLGFCGGASNVHYLEAVSQNDTAQKLREEMERIYARFDACIKALEAQCLH